MTKEILIIESDGLIDGLLSKNLSRKGYSVAVLQYKDILAQARAHKPNLVILDVPSGEVEVVDICRLLHEATLAPIIALVDSSVAPDDIEGITYLTKPPAFRELLAVVEATLSRRRKRKKPVMRHVRLGELALDLHTRRLIKGDRKFKLTPKEFLLLKMFMTHPGQVLSHKAIMQEVWDTSYLGDTRTLYVHVSWIRQKIEEEPGRPVVLRTVRGVGYRFETPP